MNIFKKSLAMFLVLCMLIGAVPMTAFAADIDSTEPTVTESTEETTETTEDTTETTEETGEATEETTEAAEETVETTEETTEATEETTEATEETTETTEEPTDAIEETTEATEESTEPAVDPYGLSTLSLDDELSVASTTISTITMGANPGTGSTSGEPFPQGTGGSNSFRIPALVTLSNGNLVAAADARWNTTYDGGGLDTIVARSYDSGANWNYSFANYLGDNGNEYNGSGSTAFIDPALAVSGNTVYMLCDLYPYGIALNGSVGAYPSTAVGFNSDGKLLLSGDNHSSYSYYLDGNTIYSSDGTAVSGYTVDEYFNITAEDGTTSNLFFSNSPYKVVRTGFLYLTKSTDAGATWSAPELLNLKTSSEQVCLVGPGRGLVTSSGMIVFPTYSYNGSQSSQTTSFIYSNDGGSTWNRSANFTGASWSSESAVVELSNGTLRFFYRNGTTNLCYVDYANGAWGSAVTMTIDTNSNCQISAIKYSKTIDGKQVILVSCPTGPSEAGSDQSGASYRLNGKIFAFTVESDGSMVKVGDVAVTSNENQFMYSCLTELNDGTIGILYEDKENAWGTGDSCYYTMSYGEYDLTTDMSLTFDSASSGEEDDNVEGDVIITKGATMVSAAKVENVTVLADKTYLAYDITVEETNVESATVVVKLNGAFADDADLVAVYIDDSGAVAETINGTYDTTADTFTFVATHFSTYAVTTADTDSSVAITGTVDVRLAVGETSQTYTDTTGNYEGAATNVQPNGTVATMEVAGTDASDDGEKTKTAVTTLNFAEGKSYLIVNNRNSKALSHVITEGAITWSPYTELNGFALNGDTDVSSENLQLWSIVPTGNGTYYIMQGNQYLTFTYSSASATASLTDTPTPLTLEYTGGNWYIGNNGVYLSNVGSQAIAVGYNTKNDGGNYWTIYEISGGTTPASTNVTFTGVSAGTTTAIVGSTQYNITVYAPRNIIVTYQCNGVTVHTERMTVESDAATATLPDIVVGETGTAYQNNTTALTLKDDVASYIVEVTELEAITAEVAVGGSATLTQENLDALTEGQYVVWTSADTSKVSVAANYDANGNYTTSATIIGNAETEENSPVLVTGIVYNADGTVAYSTKFAVTVTEGTGNTNTTSKYIYINIARIQNTTVYYNINGGELIQITDDMLDGPYTDENGTYYKLKVALKDEQYTGGFQISFFAAPDEGYALTYMSSTNSAGEYYTLSDGNADGVGSDAWPFVDGYDYDSFDSLTSKPAGSNTAVFDTSKGIRWGLVEGNFTVAQMKVMFANAISKGCDGILVFTKNNTGTSNGSTSNYGGNDLVTDLAFVSQKLPELEKEITSITHSNGTTETYTEGMTLALGDTINYTITVYEPTTVSEYGSITYSAIKLVDPLTGNTWTSKSSSYQTGTYTFTNSATGEKLTMDAKAYTYTPTSLTLAVTNLLELVDDNGYITNTADLEYTYSSEYSQGTLDATASAVAQAKVEVPEYVIDFGLPVEFNLTNNPLIDGYETIVNATAQYGDVTFDGLTVTYTPTQILQGNDFIRLTIADNQGSTNNIGYGIRIYPATTVHYEESFITWGSNWSGGNEAITVGVQATEQLNTAAQGAATSDNPKQFNYGYDPVYANTTGASNGTNATTSTIGAKATFTFTGNGIQVFANCTESSGYVSVQVTNSSGAIVNMSMVDTIVDEGTTNATSGQTGELYGLPIVSLIDLQNMPHDTYTVTITKIMDTEPVYIDGIRVFNTVADSGIFKTDLEDDPSFYELRDTVLHAIGVAEDTSVDYKTMYEQVYNAVADADALIIDETVTYGNSDTIQDLLDNGPKNEIYLYAGQMLTFKVSTNRVMQVGLKAPQGATTASISVDGGTTTTTQNVGSSVDMFYSLANKADVTKTYTVQIKNTGDKILSVTELKICDDPNAVFVPFTVEEIELILCGEAEEEIPVEPSAPEEETPTEPSEPEIPEEPTEPETEPTRPTKPGKPGSNKPGDSNRPGRPTEDTGHEEAEAVLNIVFINLWGKKVGTATLTETGNENSRCVFSASEISAQAPGNYRALWFFPAIVSYGDTATIIVTVI